MLGVSEQSRPRQKPHTTWCFEREASAASRNDIDREMRVLPVRELLATDVDGRLLERPEEHILRTDTELALWIAHRRTPIATAAGLMQQERAVFGFELRQQRERCGCRANPRHPQ
jgi:hypothetical protein